VTTWHIEEATTHYDAYEVEAETEEEAVALHLAGMSSHTLVSITDVEREVKALTKERVADSPFEVPEMQEKEGA
jgi:hypothetical protein